jgi:nitric oxide reductase large subunit
MRQLLAEPPFTAQRLVHPPLVYLWIPVAILSFALFVWAVRRCVRRRRRAGVSSC